MHTESTQTQAPPASETAVPRPRRLAHALRVRFRLHTAAHSAPPTMRVFGLAFCSALCAFVGLIPAGRLIVALLMGDGPWWYPPIAVAIGMIGVAAITAAFAAIHRSYLPWYLLGVAAIMLGANLTLVYTVF